MNDYTKAHKHSSNHKTSLLPDQLCGCFYCLTIFNSDQIVEWIEDDAGTAVCPFCGVDALIGESSGYPITLEFLTGMFERWF